MEKVVSSRISEWLEMFPADDVEKEVVRLKERLAEIQNLIGELQDEHGVISLELTKAEQAMLFREHLRGIEESQERVLGAEERTVRLRGKSAVMTIFHEGPPNMALRADDVRELMVERGWMDSDEDTHSIQVALSRLARDGKLERARQGVYRLPTSEEASTLTDVQSENGDGSEGRADLRAVSEGLPLSLEGAPDEAHRAGS